MVSVTPLNDVYCRLGEGPTWDVEQQRLYWLDCLGPNIYACNADGDQLESWSLPERIGSMALRQRGGAVLAMVSGLYLFDFTTGKLTLVADPEPDQPSNCLNDGKVDRQGRFIFGSMDGSENAPTGSLYRLDPDFSIHRLDTGFVVSNGPCWSPDGRTLYFQDSYARTILAYHYALTTGSVSNRRVFATLQTEAGAADGSTVDAEGYVWNAQIFDGKLVRYAPDGSIDRVVDMPLLKVTSLAFGGPYLDRLYVTSMGEQILPGFPPDGQGKGQLHVVDGLGVWGIAERRFAG